MRIKSQNLKIKDSNIKKADMRTAMLHPELTPHMRENVGATGVWFISRLNDSELAKYLYLRAPDLYYYPEKKEYEKIFCPKGDYVKLPHSIYQMYPSDGKSLMDIKIRAIEEL